MNGVATSPAPASVRGRDRVVYCLPQACVAVSAPHPRGTALLSPPRRRSPARRRGMACTAPLQFSPRACARGQGCRMANVVCRVSFEGSDGAALPWGDGTAWFDPPCKLTRYAAGDFWGQVRSARECLQVLVKERQLIARGRRGDVAGAAYALARAGHGTYRRLLGPDDGVAEKVRGWLARPGGEGTLDSFEIVIDPPKFVPWNAVYDRVRVRAELDAAGEAAWRPFWGFRYNLRPPALPGAQKPRPLAGQERHRRVLRLRALREAQPPRALRRPLDPPGGPAVLRIRPAPRRRAPGQDVPQVASRFRSSSASTCSPRSSRSPRGTGCSARANPSRSTPSTNSIPNTSSARTTSARENDLGRPPGPAETGRRDRHLCRRRGTKG